MLKLTVPIDFRSAREGSIHSCPIRQARRNRGRKRREDLSGFSPLYCRRENRDKPPGLSSVFIGRTASPDTESKSRYEKKKEMCRG